MSRLLVADCPFDDPALIGALVGQDRAARAEVQHAALAQGGGRMPVWPVSDPAMARVAYLAAVLGLEKVPLTLTLDGVMVEAVQYRVVDTSSVAVREDGRWPAIRREAAIEILSYQGSRQPQEVTERLAMILSRADAKVLARQSDHPTESGFDDRNIHMVARRRPYSEYFALEEYVFSHTRFDGRESPVVERAALIAADAVTVLPYDPVRDRVLLVEQIRVAPIARGDRQPWLLEAVAGRIEPGDTPEQTAHKEAQEEAGLGLTKLFPVADYYPSTGCFSEYVYSFIGLADLPDGAAGLGGVPSEGEDICGHILPRSVFMDRVRAGEIRNAPLLLSALWLEANLAQVRGAG